MEQNVYDNIENQYYKLNIPTGQCPSKCLCSFGTRSLYDQMQMKKYNPNVGTPMPEYIEAFSNKRYN